MAITDLLSPATLSRISNFQLLARHVVEGFISGMHRSVRHGFGSEFLQYRDYTPGDDLKYIDWKAYGRSNRYYSKVFQEETNFNCHIVVDCSASMDYKGTKSACSKMHYAKMVAASLAYLADKQGDAVGLFAYSNDCQSMIPPRYTSGHLHRIFNTISTLKAHGEADHSKQLNLFGETIRRRGVIVFISDFIGDKDNLVPLLKKLQFTRHDCILIQVLDNDELELPFNRSNRFVDSESGEVLITAPSAIRKEYISRLNEYLSELKTDILNSGLDFLSTNTGNELGEIIGAYLHKREATL